MKNIGIVGAGLIGRLIALSLHRQGYQITLFDKDTKAAHNSAAYAAAGLLTPLGEAPHCEKNIVEMGFSALDLWPKLLNSLTTPVFFQQSGSLLVNHEHDQGDYIRFNRFIKSYYSEYTQQNLNREQLRLLEPELGRSFKQGIFLPQEGQIDNRELLNALRIELEKEKINWLSETVVDEITPQENGCDLRCYQQEIQKDTLEDKAISTAHKSNIKGKDKKQHFDLVIDCRGVGAKPKKTEESTKENITEKTTENTIEQTDNNASIADLRAVRGEMFQLYAPDVALSRPIRLMHPRYQLYIAPKKHGRYAVGATQIESDDNSPMTVRSALELLSATYSLHSGFAEANILQHISQLRPALSNNQPCILASESLIQINGLYRHGYLISPVVLAQTTELINNLKANKPLDTPCQYSHLLPITIKELDKKNENIY